jgi:putative spermidine/putrescine transport system substrate-binding protein
MAKQGRHLPAPAFRKEGESMKHARLLRTAVGSLSAAAFLAANGGAIADEIGALVEAAKKEGELTIIAVPHDWCGYAGIINDFKAKYPFLKLNELDPDAGSGDEIRPSTNKDNRVGHPT